MMPAPDDHVVSTDALVDAPVVNAAGDALGRLAYVMLDVAEGRVAYAVLAHGGELGLGERLLAIPWRSLHLDASQARFVLDIASDEPALESPEDRVNV
jgi:sporulation protein YlmC with PRC-barrel domain